MTLGERFRVCSDELYPYWSPCLITLTLTVTTTNFPNSSSSVGWQMRKISARRSRTVWRPTALVTLNGWCWYRSCGRIVVTSLMERFETPCA